MKRGAFSILPPAATLPLVVEPAKIEIESSIASGSNLKQESNPNQLSLPLPLKTSRRSSSLASSSTSSLSSLDSETSDSSTKLSRKNSAITASNNKKSRQNEYEKRRSERTNIVVDEFRTRPRLVHPPLAPPAGYLLDYKPFDPIKRVLIYEGRRQASDGKGKRKRGRITDKEKERMRKKEEKEKEKEKKAAKLGKRKRSESSPATSKGKGPGRPANKKLKPTKLIRGHDSSADESSSESDSSEEEESSEEEDDSSEEEEEVKKLLTPQKVVPKIKKKKVVPKGRTKHWCYSDEEGFDEAETLQDIVSKSVKAGLASLEAEEEAEAEEEDGSSSEESGDEADLKEGTAKSRSMVASTSNQSNESRNNRITRRNSVVPPPNLASTSATSGKLARVVNQLALVVQPRPRPTKQKPRISMPNLPTAAIPLASSSPHQTRASQPIPESLKHLIHSSAVTNGVGGWDEHIKRYLSPKKKGPNRRHSVADGGGSNSMNEYSVDISPRDTKKISGR